MRFGGEEFLVLLRETDRDQALLLADGLCRDIANTQLLPEGGVTVSIGVSDVTQAEDIEHWYKLSDAALYLAKRGGRNRVEVAKPERAEAQTNVISIPMWR